VSSDSVYTMHPYMMKTTQSPYIRVGDPPWLRTKTRVERTPTQLLQIDHPTDAISSIPICLVAPVSIIMPSAASTEYHVSPVTRAPNGNDIPDCKGEDKFFSMSVTGSNCAIIRVVSRA
jgi:hypothetical protein